MKDCFLFYLVKYRTAFAQRHLDPGSSMMNYCFTNKILPNDNSLTVITQMLYFIANDDGDSMLYYSYFPLS